MQGVNRWREAGRHDGGRQYAWRVSDAEQVAAGNGEPRESKAELDRAFEQLYRDHLRDVYSYSYYRVGQASSYGAIAARREGRILFAGEHTSIANIGFLDGAVETGERAARRLLRALAR